VVPDSNADIEDSNIQEFLVCDPLDPFGQSKTYRVNRQPWTGEGECPALGPFGENHRMNNNCLDDMYIGIMMNVRGSTGSHDAALR
jgi:hypothetical protein